MSKVLSGISPYTPPDDTREVRAQDAIRMLIECDGDRYVAAEKLGITPGKLMFIVIDEPGGREMLMDGMRGLELFHNYEMAKRVRAVIDEQVAPKEVDGEMVGGFPSEDLVGLLRVLAREQNAATEPKAAPAAAVQINVLEGVVKALPAHLRDPFVALAQKRAELGEAVVIEHEDNPNFIERRSHEHDDGE